MANKKFGRHSQQANDFLQPNAVSNLTATNVGTNRPYLATANTTSEASASGTGGSVSLSWSSPSASSPAPTSYTITTTPSTYTATVSAPATSYTFQGLASNTS